MHPIERLRYVARATGAAPDEVVREAASSLAGFSSDPTALVTACRRLIDRHPANAPIWWLCARVLCAPDPGDEAWRCLDEVHADPAPGELEFALPDAARLVVVGWPERVAGAVARRGDVHVRVVDVDGDGPGFVRALERFDVDAADVPVRGLAAAVADSSLVVLEGLAIGPEVALTSAGSWAAASVARTAGVPVWLLGGVGRVVRPDVWPALAARLARGRATPPWEAEHDHLPLDLVDAVIGASGPEPVADALRRRDAPDAAELRR